MSLRRFIWVWLLLGLAGPVCAHAAEHKLRVVTSFLPIYCFTANVAGNLADVENLLPPGVEPHEFQFSPREMKRLEAADVIVANGLGIENWLGRVIGGQGRRQVLVTVSTGLKDELITNAPYLDPQNPGASAPISSPPNPHIWLDPQL